MKNFIKWQDIDKSIDNEHIRMVESEINLSFPKNFVDFILEYNGATSTKDLIILDEDNGELIFERFLNFSPKSEDYIVDYIEKVKEFYNGIIPFASDGLGNYYCFDFRNKKEPYIVQLDTEQLMSEEEEPFIPVAINFDKFIYNLNELNSK